MRHPWCAFVALGGVVSLSTKRAAARLFEQAAAVSAGDNSCVSNLEVDLMFLIGNTKGMEYYNLFVYAGITAAVDKVRENVADLRVAFSTVNDQPYLFSGRNGSYTSDQYCSRLEASFDAPWEDIVKSAYVAYEDARTGLYEDLRPYAKDIFGALAKLAFTPEAKWRTGPSSPARAFKKVMFVVTEGIYRAPFDGLSTFAEIALPSNDGTPEYECGLEDFYTKEQAANLIKRGEILPVVVAGNVNGRLYSEFFKEFGINAYVPFVIGTDELRDRIADYILEALGELACLKETTD